MEWWWWWHVVVEGGGGAARTTHAYNIWFLSPAGVLLYVMLSKMMPFRAKEVDLLLKQAPEACEATPG